MWELELSKNQVFRRFATQNDTGVSHSQSKSEATMNGTKLNLTIIWEMGKRERE